VYSYNSDDKLGMRTSDEFSDKNAGTTLNNVSAVTIIAQPS
jgi:hypothetical protein